MAPIEPFGFLSHDARTLSRMRSSQVSRRSRAGIAGRNPLLSRTPAGAEIVVTPSSEARAFNLYGIRVALTIPDHESVSIPVRDRFTAPAEPATELHRGSPVRCRGEIPAGED